jgi:hypothetical protein
VILSLVPNFTLDPWLHPQLCPESKLYTSICHVKIMDPIARKKKKKKKKKTNKLGEDGGQLLIMSGSC